MYSMKKYILLFISFSIFSQNFNTTDFNIDSNFNIIQNEVAQAYTKKAINYAGNRYYFKKPKKALLNLFDGDKPIKVTTNYNLLEQTFDIETDNNKTLKLLPNKVYKVTFEDKIFISIKGKFYELINQNENFTLLADTFLETYMPDYTPGIQVKPDPTYRKSNEIMLLNKNRFFKIQRNKKFIINMFSSSKSKEINTFFKKNKISPRDDDELSILFLEFYSDLII